MVNNKMSLRDVVSSLKYDELINLQKDLYSGGSKIRQLITNKIKEISATESRTCATCGSPINLRLASEFTFIFGTSEQKKRASFCALDCMDYFTNSLKRLTRKSKPQQRQTRQQAPR